MGSWRVAYTSACADPGFYFGGRGGGAARRQTKVWTFFVFFLVLNLFDSLQRASIGFITEKTILSKDPEGVQQFPGGGGVQLFP